MKLYYFIGVIGLSGLLVACNKQPAQASQQAPQASSPAPVPAKIQLKATPLAVKGFYIGMAKEKVFTLLDTYGLTDRNETVTELAHVYPIKLTIVKRLTGTFKTTEYHQNPNSQFSYDTIPVEVTKTNYSHAQFLFDDQDKLIVVKLDYEMVCFFFGVSSWKSTDLAQIVMQENRMDKMNEKDWPVTASNGRVTGHMPFYYYSDDVSEVGFHEKVGFWPASVFYLVDIKYSFTRNGVPFL